MNFALIGKWLIAGAVLAPVLSISIAPKRSFSDSERDSVLQFWANSPSVKAEPVKTQAGKWTVSLTPEGSRWLWQYNRNRGFKKTNPQVNPGPQNSDQQAWEKWISAKIAYDRYKAGEDANNKNAEDLGVSPDSTMATIAEDPGPASQALVDLVGEPVPSFAEAITQTKYTVAFSDGTQIAMTDQPVMRPTYAYLRFPKGVDCTGTTVAKMAPDEVRSLFKDAGLSEKEQKVMLAVSMLEGGFDSLNTYDTGYVSAGFIQFAALAEGGGSLGEMMLDYKQRDPRHFNTDFRQFGLDVNDGGILIAIDPATGEEKSGPDAAKLIIDDKRLSAVFVKDGRTSRAFKIAQILSARKRFYPADDVVKVNGPNGQFSCKVGDVIKSEAGMAIIMDRKVNTGHIDPLPGLLQTMAYKVSANNAGDLLGCEASVLPDLIYRQDFTQDDSLTRPEGMTVKPRPSNTASRSGKRNARKKSG